MNDLSPIRAPAPALPPCHAPGVYFGLAEARYHADPALGSTDLRLLLKSASDFWWQSPMNALRAEREETPALLYGRALHKLVLEGSEAFAGAFCAEPDKADYPGALITNAQLEAFLIEKGTKPRAKTKKEDLEAAARPLLEGTDAVIWSDVMRVATLEAKGRALLKPKMHAEVIMAAAEIARNERLTEAFRNGRAEVSIFWERGGVRLKSRIDYLKVKQLVNLKSFRPKNEAPPHMAVMAAIAAHRYDMQAALHLEARAELARLVRAGRVFAHDGALPAADWLAAVAAEQEFEAWLAFYQAEGAPNVLPRRFKRGSPVAVAAAADLELALSTFRQNLERHGSEAWPYEDPFAIDPDVDFDNLPKWFKPELVS